MLDSSAQSSASDVARALRNGTPIGPTTGGVTLVQVVDARDRVVTGSLGADLGAPVLPAADLEAARSGKRFNIVSPRTGLRERVLAQKAGDYTVLVVTDLTRVDDSVEVTTRVALVGGPLAVLLMGFATYLVARLTLRPVAALRHGAEDITAAGLAEQRLPVPSAQDEIHRLAITLNQMLDRIDSSTQRQRTFVGDAAHELRSPLASLRVQLEVVQRMGPESGLPAFIDDVLEDVSRLDRFVEDLLALARLDERATSRRLEPVLLDSLVSAVAAGYVAPVSRSGSPESEPTELIGDPDALRRVLVNLVDNALRYAHTEVTISVRPAMDGKRRPSHSRWPTTGPASRRPSASGSSTGSTASRRAGRASPAGPGWDCRSSVTWCARTAGRSPCRRAPTVGAGWSLRCCCPSVPPSPRPGELPRTNCSRTPAGRSTTTSRSTARR